MPKINNPSIPDPRAPHERLTQMQYLVACGVVAMLSNTAIGRKLSIHRTTVVRYRQRIARMTGLDGKMLHKYAMKHGVFGIKKTEN